MARKSFLDNPAMRFITLDEEPKAVEPEEKAAPQPPSSPGRKKSQAQQDGHVDVHTHNHEDHAGDKDAPVHEGDDVGRSVEDHSDQRVDPPSHRDEQADKRTHARTDPQSSDPSPEAALPPADTTDTKAANESASAHTAANAYQPEDIEAYIDAYQPTTAHTAMQGNVHASTDRPASPHERKATHRPMTAHVPTDSDDNAHMDAYANASNEPYTPTHIPTHTQSSPDSAPMFLPRRESKSKRLQLLIKPSTHAQLLRIAHAHDTSVNDAVNAILEDYIRKGL